MTNDRVNRWLYRSASWMVIAASASLVWRRNRFIDFGAYEPAAKPSDMLILASFVLLLVATSSSSYLRRELHLACRHVSPWITYPLLIVLFYSAGALWSAVFMGQALGVAQLADFGRICIGILFFSLVIFFGFRRRSFREAIFLSFFSSLVLVPFLFVPLQWSLDWFLVVGPSSLTFLGFQNSTVFNASLLVIPTVFAFAGVLVSRDRPRAAWGFAVICTLLFALLWWAGSRAGWVAAVFGMVTVLVFARWRRGLRGILLSLVAMAGVLLLSFAILPSFAKTTTLSRILPGPMGSAKPGIVIATSASPMEYLRESGGAISIDLRGGRLEIWSAYLRHGFEGLVGFGPNYADVWNETNMSGQTVNAHSVWLELLVSGGVGALATFLLMLWRIFRGLVPRVLERPELMRLGILGGLVGVIVDASFFDSLGLRWVWVVLALAALESGSREPVNVIS